MKLSKLFGKSEPTISKLHSERVATVAKWREELTTKRQELVWKHQSELSEFDTGPGKDLSDFEAAIAAFEAKHEETIATEALGALRAGASMFGDQPRTATIAIRDAWRAYVARVRDELGNEEPNCALLAAAFVDDDLRDGIGGASFHASTAIQGDLARAIGALVEDSIPRMTYTLQMLSIASDEGARAGCDEPNADVASAILTCATNRTFTRRAEVGCSFGMAVSALNEHRERVASRAETLARREREQAKSIVPPPRPVPEALAAAQQEAPEAPFL